MDEMPVLRTYNDLCPQTGLPVIWCECWTLDGPIPADYVEKMAKAYRLINQDGVWYQPGMIDSYHPVCNNTLDDDELEDWEA
jgi:hypothetical protein